MPLLYFVLLHVPECVEYCFFMWWNLVSVWYYSCIAYACRGEWIPGQRPLLHDMPVAVQQDITYNDALHTIGQVTD